MHKAFSHLRKISPSFLFQRIIYALLASIISAGPIYAVDADNLVAETLAKVGFGAPFGLDLAKDKNGFITQFSSVQPYCNDIPGKGDLTRSACYASKKILSCPYGSSCEISCSWEGHILKSCTLFYGWLDDNEISLYLNKILGPPKQLSDRKTWNNKNVKISIGHALGGPVVFISK